MRINEYKSINEFIGEYSGERNDKYDIVYGLDFKFNEKLYRMSIDQIEPDDLRKKFERKLKRKLEYMK